jgi:hypothetical protein
VLHSVFAAAGHISMSKEIASEHRPPAPSLSIRDVQLQVEVNNVWRCVAPRSTSRERLLENSFWSVVSNKFRPWDEIIVCAADRSFRASYLVLEAGLGYCSLQELTWQPLEALLASPDDLLPSNHRIEFGGVDDGWMAIRNSDSVVVIRNAKSSQECLERLLEHNSVRQSK